jgi:hypothetical protein
VRTFPRFECPNNSVRKRRRTEQQLVNGACQRQRFEPTSRVVFNQAKAHDPPKKREREDGPPEILGLITIELSPTRTWDKPLKARDDSWLKGQRNPIDPAALRVVCIQNNSESDLSCCKNATFVLSLPKPIRNGRKSARNPERWAAVTHPNHGMRARARRDACGGK